MIKRRITKLLTVFISLILLIPSVCSASISRHEEDDGYFVYYKVDKSERDYSISIILSRDMTVNEWLKMYFDFWVPHTGDLDYVPDKNRNVILHIGNISYNLTNNGYKQSTKECYTFKESRIPFDVARIMRNAINNKDIWYEIPLERGDYFSYTPSADDLSEYAEAYDAYMEEADSIRNTYGN